MRKFLNLIFLILLIFPLFNVEKKKEKICNYEYYQIKEENFFKQKNNYFIFVYLDKCLACRDSKLILQNVCLNSNENIYYLNFEETHFKENEKNSTNINVSSYHNIYLKSVPALFYIQAKKIVEEYYGVDDIRNKFYKK